MSSTPLPTLPLDELPDVVDVSDNSLALAQVRQVIDAGPFSDDWPSLQTYQPPLWYLDAKFGIFLHWGVYSVPAFNNEWYSREMYLPGHASYEHHRATYGSQEQFGYKDFIASFTMENFDAAQWAQLFRRAGAQFVVPVAEHHDGFAMYDTDRSRWSAARLGPCRDVLGELSQAVDQAWMVRGASSHRAEHWFFMNGGTRFPSDVRDPRWADFYGPAQREEVAPNERFLEDWLLRTVEIIDNYRPQVLWFDWWIEQPAFEPYVRQLAAYYYNRAAEWGRGVVINHKWESFAPGAAVYDIERGAMAEIRPQVWQNDTSVAKDAWCFVHGHQYKSASDLVAELVDVVSKNGVLLLNVGPTADGRIPEPEVELLEQVGDWLTLNGEAIYGTRPWLVAGEGPTRRASGSFVDGDAPTFTPTDVRFTTRHDVTGDYLYATVMAWPSDGRVRIQSWGAGRGMLTRPIRSVDVLGCGLVVSWAQDEDALVVELAGQATALSGPVIKVHLEPTTTPERTDFLHG